jgi:hypothetical protein
MEVDEGVVKSVEALEQVTSVSLDPDAGRWL